MRNTWLLQVSHFFKTKWPPHHHHHHSPPPPPTTQQANKSSSSSETNWGRHEANKQGNRRKVTLMISQNLALLQLCEGQLGLGDSYTTVWMAVGGETERAVWSAFTDEDDRAVDDWSVLCYCGELQMDRSTCHHLAPQSEMAFLLSAFQQSVSVTKDCWESEPLFHSTPSLHIQTHTHTLTPTSTQS